MDAEWRDRLAGEHRRFGAPGAGSRVHAVQALSTLLPFCIERFVGAHAVGIQRLPLIGRHRRERVEQ